MITKSLKWTLTGIVLAISLGFVYNLIYYSTVVLIEDKGIASNLASTGLFIVLGGFIIDIYRQAIEASEKRKAEVKELAPRQVKFYTVKSEDENVQKNVQSVQDKKQSVKK